jgi:hypothetical protein
VKIQDAIREYYPDSLGRHHRYRSWEHCYRYFRKATRDSDSFDHDHAALHLGFYLASWGMYRGSSFLLQHDYTIHSAVVERLVAPQFSTLWEDDLRNVGTDPELVAAILKAVDTIREAYQTFARSAESDGASDTLVTKVVLGTFGCLPACDRFFIDGWKSAGNQYSYLNAKFVNRLISFSRTHISDLRGEQARIEQIGGLRYPIMKLVDMYFWQSGLNLDRGSVRDSPESPRATAP